jgi:hypothetical protein
MKTLCALSLSLFLALPLPLMAQEPVGEVTMAWVLPYLPEDLSDRKSAATVEEGVDGAPDHLEIGMILKIIDSEDPTLTAIAEVTGNVGDGVTVSDTKFTITFISR